LIYLDNAATTWPKPDTVWEAVVACGKQKCGNPGRSGHRLAVEAAREVFAAREAVAELFNTGDSSRIVFTWNATGALNTALQGFLRSGGHVITSSMEHNSVMRPLRAMELRGVEVSVVACSADGTLDPDDVGKAIRRQTALVVLTHASNVSGTVMPVSQVGAITSERGIPLCVDASQTAGCLPIDVGRDGIDLLAFTGHKSLYGPQGTGGLYVREGLEARISPLAMGGTGSASEREEQPLFMPDKYESGTPNTPGIAGLLAGIDFVASQGVERIREHEMTLARRLMEGLAAIEGIRVIGPRDPYHRIAVVSFTLEGVEPSEVAFRLDDEFGIMIRSGLHCAPSAHRALGTFPQGTVRASIGFFNTARDIDETIDAVASIAYNR